MVWGRIHGGDMTRHLVGYEYGSGAAWGFVLAPSSEAVREALPHVEVYDDPPEWMTNDDLDHIAAHATIEVSTASVDAILEGKKVQGSVDD